MRLGLQSKIECKWWGLLAWHRMLKHGDVEVDACTGIGRAELEGQYSVLRSTPHAPGSASEAVRS